MLFENRIEKVGRSVETEAKKNFVGRDGSEKKFCRSRRKRKKILSCRSIQKKILSCRSIQKKILSLEIGVTLSRVRPRLHDTNRLRSAYQ